MQTYDISRVNCTNNMFGEEASMVPLVCQSRGREVRQGVVPGGREPEAAAVADGPSFGARQQG